MQKYFYSKLLLLSISFFFNVVLLHAQNTESDVPLHTIDMEKARVEIEAIEVQFSEAYSAGDSLALADMYASDAQFGSLEGPEILAYWGRSIRNSIKNNTTNLTFTITSLNDQEEFLIEMGIFKKWNSQMEVVSEGRYMVIWKKENGVWKIYRDFGL